MTVPVWSSSAVWAAAVTARDRVTGYRVEASLLRSLTSFGASSVPPGTYYVRVRAGNYTGLGAPSNEVVLAMP